MKKITLILLGFLFPLHFFAQQQILITNDGTSVTFNVLQKKHENKVLTLTLKADWVNEDLKPIINTTSVLVIKKGNLKITANQPLNIVEFLFETELRFNKEIELNINYNGKKLSDLKIEILPLYSSSNSGKSESFAMVFPEKYIKEFSNVSGPKIVITNPAAGRGLKPLIEIPQVTITGYILSKIPITTLTINNEKIQFNEKGEFSHTITVKHKGESPILIIAIDSLNSITKQKLILDYRPPVTFEDIKELSYYALIIGVQDYEDQMLVDLNFPINDASNLYNLLTNSYTFDSDKVIYLKNATNSQIVKSLDSLSNLITKEDNLLIFYAGHGYWDSKTEIGYWLPSDADMTDKSTWFRNSSLKDYISSIKSNHTLLIADACFSGSIFKTRGAFNKASIAIEKLYNMPSRRAMTSGTLKEVPDKSVFIKYLLERLQDNNKSFISASELFSSFRDAVLNNSPNIPQYGTIRDTGDEGGDFIFVKKK